MWKLRGLTMRKPRGLMMRKLKDNVKRPNILETERYNKSHNSE